MKSLQIILVERLQQALNTHNLEAIATCVAPDFTGDQPVHPNRAFQGSEQVQKNWSNIFQAVPNFHAELLRSTVAGDTVWTEWHWTGTRRDNARFDLRGIILFTVEGDQIRHSRMYMEPVQEAGGNVDKDLKNITQGEEPKG